MSDAPVDAPAHCPLCGKPAVNHVQIPGHFIMYLCAKHCDELEHMLQAYREGAHLCTIAERPTSVRTCTVTVKDGRRTLIQAKCGGLTARIAIKNLVEALTGEVAAKALLEEVPE